MQRNSRRLARRWDLSISMPALPFLACMWVQFGRAHLLNQQPPETTRTRRAYLALPLSCNATTTVGEPLHQAARLSRSL
jgi:hypothetical protein